MFVSHTADWIGPTSSLFLLLLHLREFFEIAVLLPGTGLFTEKLESEKIHFVSVDNLGIRSVPLVLRILKQGKYDLVYGNTKDGSSRNAFIAAKLGRVAFVCHVREMGWEKSWKQMGFLRFSDAVIAVSSACANSISRYVARGRLHVVYNGVPPSPRVEHAAARDYLLEQTGLTPDCCVLVNVGHVCPRKGQLMAVEAMAKVVQSAPSAVLFLIGDCDRDVVYANAVRETIKTLGLESQVHLLGFRRDVLQLMQGADVLVHTPAKDPHPRVVLEAMAAGLPVVALAVDGVAETVLDATTGFLIPPGDLDGVASAILKLLDSRELRGQMGRAGQYRVHTQFSAETSAHKVMEIIDAVLRKDKQFHSQEA